MPKWPTTTKWPTGSPYPAPDPVQATTTRTLLEWWRPDQGLAADISSWSGIKGNIVSQGTAGSRPAYEATGFAGKPSLLFDGVDDCMIATSGALIAAVSGSDVPFTAYTVFEFANLSASGTVFSFTNNGSNSIYHWQYGTATTWTSQRQGGDVASVLTGGTTAATTKYFMRHQFTGTTTTVRVNQLTVISGAQDNASATFNRFAFGNVPIATPTGFSNIRLADHWIIDGAASVYEESLYAAYVAYRYGIAS